MAVIVLTTLASALPPLLGWGEYVPESSGMSCAPNWEVGAAQLWSCNHIQIVENGRPVFHDLPFYSWVLPAPVHHHLHQHEGAHEDEAGEPACHFIKH